MEIFSEIYGKYYRIMSSLLRNGKQSSRKMRETIRDLGFAETDLYFEPSISSGSWPLLKKSSDGEYEPIVGNEQALPPTILEKSWLKAVLEDERVHLFLSEEEISAAKEKLADVKPLFNEKNIIAFDKFDVGDEYTSETIQKHFSLLIEAMRGPRAVRLTYLSAKGKYIEGNYVPCKFEYSSKNDRFRLLAIELNGEGYCGYSVLNLGRIKSVELTDILVEENYEEYFLGKRTRFEKIIDIELYDERNAMERFMVEFSNCKKEAVYDKENNILRVKLHIDNLDVNEILVKILGFGPVLKVVGPEDFVDLIKARLQRQKNLR